MKNVNLYYGILATICVAFICGTILMVNTTPPSSQLSQPTTQSEGGEAGAIGVVTVTPSVPVVTERVVGSLEMPFSGELPLSTSEWSEWVINSEQGNYSFGEEVLIFDGIREIPVKKGVQYSAGRKLKYKAVSGKTFIAYSPTDTVRNAIYIKLK